MATRFQRNTVNLATFPDLVVIYLGMRVRTLRGLKTVIRFGPRISAAGAAKPDGLLLHESVFYSVYALHVGMRQYWRDFQSLENGLDRSPIRRVGRNFWPTQAVWVSGTRLISSGEAWRPFTTM